DFLPGPLRFLVPAEIGSRVFERRERWIERDGSILSFGIRKGDLAGPTWDLPLVGQQELTRFAQALDLLRRDRLAPQLVESCLGTCPSLVEDVADGAAGGSVGVAREARGKVAANRLADGRDRLDPDLFVFELG